MDFATPSGQAVPAGRRPASHLWFLLVPILTAGVASFVLPLWAIARQRAAQQRRGGSASLWGDGVAERPAPRLAVSTETLLGLSVCMGLGTVAVFSLMSLAPTDATGSPTGLLSTLATLLALVLIAAGVACALTWRSALFPATVSPQIALLNAARVPEPVAKARARRALREQYRRLAAADPVLAREIGVGRPTSEGLVDDGGLIDLNSLSADELASEAKMALETAEEIVALRGRQNGLSSVDEVVVFVRMPTRVEEQLRECAVFL